MYIDLKRIQCVKQEDWTGKDKIKIQYSVDDGKTFYYVKKNDQSDEDLYIKMDEDVKDSDGNHVYVDLNRTIFLLGGIDVTLKLIECDVDCNDNLGTNIVNEATGNKNLLFNGDDAEYHLEVSVY